MRRYRSLVTPWRTQAALIGLGGVLIGITVFEMYRWWVIESIIEISFVAGILMSLPAAGLLVVGGYRLPRSSVTEEYYSRLLAWTVAGATLFGGFSVITGITFFPDVFWAQVGSIRWGISVGSGSGFLIGFLIARGIEQRVEAERAAVRAEEAEEKQEILEYLNALLRHEVLNTANVINGHATLLESTLEANTDRQEYVEVIKRQTEEVSTVIDDVQFLLEASGGDQSLKPIDLRSVLETELRNVRDRYTNVETELDAPGETPVMADHLVRRLFANLLRNAIKHNNSEQKHVSVSVTETAETVTVEIEDNGPGIPEEDREGIFDPEIKKRANHGLGLTIVARLTERYEGDVDLVETGADGTIFAVRLPTPPAESGGTAEKAKPQSEDRF